jgi:long-chain acyl-CoA synthetase
MAPVSGDAGPELEPELPRSATGKLFKRLLKDRYWRDHQSRIV